MEWIVALLAAALLTGSAAAGIGISSEHVTDVCRRFFREGRGNRTEGLGIGLYLTREILEKEQGYMKIRSEIDEGTEVSLYLLNFMK